MKNINELYINALKKCIEIREVELSISTHYPKQIFRCPVHLAIGHEAICSALMSVYSETKERYLFSYHRSHHHFLSSGASLEDLLYEIGGSPKGACQGAGGSHHLRSAKNHFMGSTPIITGTLPVSVGFAHGIKMRELDSRVFVFMGDTCAEEGLFYESLNTASLYQLPITFVIENNGLSCYTPSLDRQGYRSFQDIAQSFKLPYFEMQGANLLQCVEKSIEHKNYFQENKGPALIHAEVFRPYEHCGYQMEEDSSSNRIEMNWPKKDPLESNNLDFAFFQESKDSLTRELKSHKESIHLRCEDVVNDLVLSYQEVLSL
ncbi:MAG: hypothetical protein CME63_10555 [Halobacteriovoraceae bacterium]|nr:hypothetical protein [Halobacteriovoraceae bacterium]|tara:strand:- start:74702 stop:75658 length:957 start_codon:yes stop_codon:yes gene_type:complete